AAGGRDLHVLVGAAARPAGDQQQRPRRGEGPLSPVVEPAGGRAGEGVLLAERDGLGPAGGRGEQDGRRDGRRPEERGGVHGPDPLRAGPGTVPPPHGAGAARCRGGSPCRLATVVTAAGRPGNYGRRGIPPPRRLRPPFPSRATAPRPVFSASCPAAPGQSQEG